MEPSIDAVFAMAIKVQRYWGTDALNLIAVSGVFLVGFGLATLRAQEGGRRRDFRIDKRQTEEFETEFGGFQPSEINKTQRLRTQWQRCGKTLLKSWEQERIQADINAIAQADRWRIAFAGQDEQRYWHEMGLPLEINVTRVGQVRDLAGLMKPMTYGQRFHLEWLGVEIGEMCSLTQADCAIRARMRQGDALVRWNERGPDPIQTLFYSHVRIPRPDGGAVDVAQRMVNALSLPGAKQMPFSDIKMIKEDLLSEWRVFTSILEDFSSDEKAAEFGVRVPSLGSLYQAFIYLLDEGKSEHDINLQLGLLRDVLVHDNPALSLGPAGQRRQSRMKRNWLGFRRRDK